MLIKNRKYGQKTNFWSEIENCPKLKAWPKIKQNVGQNPYFDHKLKFGQQPKFWAKNRIFA